MSNRIGEMVLNGSFEYEGGGGADIFAWWVEGANDGTIERDNVTASDGDWCCKFTAAAGGGTAPRVSYTYEVIPGMIITLSFDSYGDNTAQGRYQVYDATNSADIVATSNTGNTVATWVTKTHTFTVPAGCLRMTLNLFGSLSGGSGVVRFDNVSLYVPHTRIPRIIGFGDTYATMEALPLGDATLPIGAGQGQSTRVTLPGGRTFDYGRGEIPPVVQGQTVEIRGAWVASSYAEMVQKSFQLNSLLGKRSKLWREFGDDNIHWRWARCVTVESDTYPQWYPYHATYTLRFETDSGPWHGRDWTRTTVLATDTTSAVLRNLGNAPVTDAIMTITAASTTITALSVVGFIAGDESGEAGYVSWTWEGSLAATDELVVDSGKSTILLEGVDAYSGFALATNLYQSVPDWIYLVPGRNVYTVARVGGGALSTVTFAYDEGWL